MTKKLIIGISLVVLMGIGMRSCYRHLFCEYIPVLNLDDGSEFILEDSTIIVPFISLDGKTTIRSVLRFEGVDKQIQINSITQEIVSIKNAKQPIELSHVLTYTDTVNWERVNNSRIRASNFAEFPEKYKFVSPEREENTYIFYFKTPDILESERYLLKIKLIYSIGDRKIEIEKEIPLRQTMKWKKIQMMT
ncbi:MAG: hypothetical protein GQ574_07245 [Crocinitomix sp.]|nr:hypothetical protein [Crocinitomix sp.]